MGQAEAAPARARERLAGMSTLATAGLVLLCLVISFITQQQLLDQGGPTSLFVRLVLLGALGGGILAFGAPALAPEPWPTTADRAAGIDTLSYGLAGVALLLAAWAALLVHGNGSPTLATIAWIIGMILVLAAAVERPLAMRAPTLRLARLWPVVALLAIAVLAALLRLIDLASIPGYVHNDEANNGLYARLVADGQYSTLFTNGWASLPLLGYAYEALYFKLFGDSLSSLRLAEAVAGIGSVAVTALLGRELFTLRTGLLAGVLLALSHVAIHFSRVGHHYMQALFAVSLTIYLLVLALRYGSRLAAVGAGIVLSVDLQVYYAARVAYVIAPLVILFVLIGDYRHLRARLVAVAWIVVGWLVAVAPIGAFILGDWSDFTGRTRDVLALGGTLMAQAHVYGYYGTHDGVYILRTQLWRVLQTFNFAGDSSVQYGSPHPMLDPLSGALFPAAVAYAVCRARRAGFAVCLIAVLSVVIVGGMLTIDPPFWPRLIVLPPFLALLIAAFLDGLWQVVERLPRPAFPAGPLAGVAILAALGVVGWYNYHWYFQDYEPRIHSNYQALPTSRYARPIRMGSQMTSARKSASARARSPRA